MKTEYLMLAVAVLIGISATVTMYNAQTTGQMTYQQMLHKDYMVLRQDYDPCTQVKCMMNAPAQQMGTNIAGNTVCQCPDGEVFLTDSWRRY